MSLSRVPTELWLRIFVLLDSRSLCSTQQVCTHFCSLIKVSFVLQLVIELEKFGLCLLDAPNDYPQSQSLENVRAWRRAWFDLDLSSCTTIKMPFAQGNLYELSGGFFFTSILSVTRPKVLAYIRLPGVRDSSHEEIHDFEQWSYLFFSEGLLDFAVDVQQDLLIFVEVGPMQVTPSATVQQIFRVHIRTLSRGIPHPTAAHPVLEYTLETKQMTSRFPIVIQPIATHVAILFGARTQHDRVTALVVWDWATGQCKGTIDDPLVPFPVILTFVILSDRHILLSRQTKGDIEVWSFDSRRLAFSESPLPIRLEATFELPRIAIVNALFRSEPTSSFAVSPHTRQVRSFGVNPERAIISCTVDYIHPEENMHRIQTFISSRHLFLNILRLNSASSIPIIVPWSHWCSGTRWDIPYVSSDWICHTFGQRYVMHSTSTSKIRVLDFNPSLYDDTSTRGLTSKAKVTIRHADTAMVPDGGSGLSCVEISSDEMPNYSGIMIDEDRIIGVHSDGFGGISCLDVYVVSEIPKAL